ncbi:MAG: selenide, water dikinase SelD [Boseongicola sp.]|nr:MAG: selenide, water dikinase SelD [Boseongicola sp.]
MRDQTPLPLTREVVLIGGGHAHAVLLRAWGMNPLPGARLTLINPGATAPYTGMLPGFVAGHYQRSELEIDLVKLARFAGARIIFGAATGLDRLNKRIQVTDRPDVAYDFASFDIGITSDMPTIDGFTQHAIAAKPLGPFAQRWTRFLSANSPGAVAVIGGGVAGVELAMAMAHSLKEKNNGGVTLIETGKILSGLTDQTRRRLKRALDAAKVTVIQGKQPKAITANHILLQDGQKIASDFTVGAAGARPFDWLKDTGLHLVNGYIDVDSDLRSTNDPSIFAVGDCAHLSQSPRPKAGVFAVRSASILTHNLRAALSDAPSKRFRPQTHYLKLISLGGKVALGDKFGASISGAWVWKWKDRIDRKFMNRLGNLPLMQPNSVPFTTASGMSEVLDGGHLCGGCGAKVGADILNEIVQKIDTSEHDSVLQSAGDDAAVLRIGDTYQVITTDHLRSFWNDPYVMTRIAALHAVSDVLAMGAAPQTILAQITLPRMSEHMQREWLRECVAAAEDIAQETGAALVGGHTTMGTELFVGFTATGLSDNLPKTLSGAKVGDALVLSRAIGSGTLMSAEMKLQANGVDVAQALNVMATSQAAVATVVAKNANALTDVTGFGLAGHATQMAEASGITAEIDVENVPIMPGARELAVAGIRSTLYSANRRSAPTDFGESSSVSLLFDPQTAGGFLASVPPENLEQLLKNNPELVVIGRMLERQTSPIRLN